jgi:hypothetical protein
VLSGLIITLLPPGNSPEVNVMTPDIPVAPIGIAIVAFTMRLTQ